MPWRAALAGGIGFLMLAASGVAGADTLPAEPLARALATAEVAADALGPEPRLLARSPTRQRQLPLFRELMRSPLSAPQRARQLAQAARRHLDSPHDLFRWAGGLATATVAEPASPATRNETEIRLRSAPDPLAAALAWMQPMAEAAGSPWPPPLPDRADLPEPLRTELALVLAAAGRARHQLEQALARLPVEFTVEILRRQAIDGRILPAPEPDLRRLLPMVDREMLVGGMLELVGAAQRLQRFVASTAPPPSVAWQVDTPLGAIVVDTTGRDNVHRLAAPLLVLDAGGNDRYEFTAAPPARHVALLLDHGGNDIYVAQVRGADPSAATLGYGILWDTAGDDHYQGGELAQAGALFGAALLVDGVGANRFGAAGKSQAYALGGIALLLAGDGNDEFTAQTHAQASAGPEGVAVLVDPAGDDRYTLDNEPLSHPSPQLPTHNVSMGQGAGRGWRPDTAGGIGILLDAGGNDRYTAQVYAQGTGYYEGVGMLIDEGGDDVFDAAWYTLGAAAHSAAGVLLKLGGGNDRYRATHSTSIAAGHDLSVAFFLDEGGDDRYELGDLGLGAGHDNGVGVFVDVGGRDRYRVAGPRCRAFGFAGLSEAGTPRDHAAGSGLFLDLAGRDEYPPECTRGANDATWRGPRSPRLLRLRSESGAGHDGEHNLPWALQLIPGEPLAAPTP